jgi:hypothetical protein
MHPYFNNPGIKFNRSDCSLSGLAVPINLFSRKGNSFSLLVTPDATRLFRGYNAP